MPGLQLFAARLQRAALVFSLLAVAAPLPAQTNPGWQLVGGATGVYLNRENGWGFGPVLRIERRSDGPPGLDAALRVFTTSTGFYNARGAQADLGIAVPFRGRPLEAAAIGGVGGVLGGDSDGTLIAAGGPYAGIRLGGRIAGRLGWSLATIGRLWVRSGALLGSAQVDAGFAFRW